MAARRRKNSVPTAAQDTTAGDRVDASRMQRLHAAGLRATGPRIAILAALEDDRRHPTAELLHETLATQYPSLSLSTVYATLETFLQRGLVRRIAAPSGKLRVDGTAQDHDHAICRACSRVFDVHRDVIARPVPPRELPEGLRVMNLHIEYDVLCAACARHDSTSAVHS
jgi:Fur family peroxide stress response transcriptional regulator